MFKFSTEIIIIINLHFLLLTTLSFPSCSTSLETNNVSDYAALMALKSRLVLSRDSILSANWTSATHHCSWFGVSCSNNNRVTILRLSGLAVGGALAPDIANISQLVELDLSTNKLGGIVPPELGFLQRLTTLNLTLNSLGGSIPPNLSRCHNLRQLVLSYNFIAGSIPKELATLGHLRHLAVDHNNLTGEIPSSYGNFSRLEYLYLHENDLSGQIPAELGKLSHLRVIGLRRANLTGSIPPSIFNISRLQIADLSINGLSGWLPENLGENLPNLERLFFDSNRITGKIPAFLSNASKLSFLYLTENDLHGEIPGELAGSLRDLLWFEFEYNRISGGIPHSLFNITTLEILKARHNYLTGELPHDLGDWLPNLHEIFLSHNLYTGAIPPSICNASNLVHLEVANNSFSGPVPMMLGKLQKLEHLNLQVNLLVGNPLNTHLDFLDSLVNCRSLEFLILESNPLNGVLPDSVGNLSRNLKVFTASSCELKGSIPYEIGNLSSLNFLGLSGNDLQGEVPSSFGSLQNLERIYLTGNQLKGSIQALCTIQILGILHLGENSFSGSVPLCLQNLTELRELSLASNNFNSTIPLGFWNLVKLEGLNLSINHLRGVLPTALGNLRAVYIMDLSANNFSGEIPNSIGSIQSLLKLNMSQNKFEGPIPNSLSNLIVIEVLDLSSNLLSGSIPSSLGSLRDLMYLNLSYNMLQGEIPRAGVFTNITYLYLMGNPKLCGASELNFPLCSAQASRKRNRRMSLALKITIPLAAASLVVIWILVWISLSRKKKVENQTGSHSLPSRHRTITYHELVIATDSFSETHLVGEGSSGMVYKGVLSDGNFVAIKVLNMQYARALRNFEAECKVLSRVRHRNLVKIISTCSNEDFKAMILEYMPNGSLDKRLHSESNPLSLVERMDIVIDVAMAMTYLHHEFIVPIVHCDLKPSNVLLDDDMTAHVADFGIAKILAHDETQMQTKSLGTIGYIAPEYGLDGQVSTRGDVYSFGILLLETFTRKRPTDDMFGEDSSLHQYISKSFPGGLTEVLDPNLYDLDSVKEGSSPPTNKTRKKQMEETLVSIIHVALLCLKELPEERIDMREVVVHLKKIRAKL